MNLAIGIFQNYSEKSDWDPSVSDAPSLLPAHFGRVTGFLGKWMILGNCALSLVTVVGGHGDLETALHMVVVPGHTC